MAVDWGIVLGVVSVVGIPAGFGIGVAMAARAPGEFRFARYCFAAAGSLTLASWIWLTYGYHLGPLKIIATGIVGAVAAIAVLLALDWVTRKQAQELPASTPVSVQIFAQCDPVGRPMVPPSGTLAMLQINAIPASQGGGGVGWGGGVAGASMDFGIQDIYRCQITNYSNDPLFKASLSLHLTFSEAIKDEQNPTSFHSGKVTIDRDWLIEIPKIDAGKETPFVFYILNASPQFVAVTLPKEIVLSSGPVNLIQPTNTLMIFPPNPLIVDKK